MNRRRATRMSIAALIMMAHSLLVSSVGAYGPQQQPPPRTTISLRREILKKIALGVVIGATSSLLSPQNCQAACFPGDTSKECIGVYKVPMEDAENLQNFMKKNPDAFKQFAPNVQTNVPTMAGVPRSLDEALEVLESQRLAADDIVNVIRVGKLEEGGIKLLNLIPRVSMAGRIVIRGAMASSPTLPTSSSSSKLEDGDEKAIQQAATIQQLKETQWETALNNVVFGFGECDILIGQGIRGELGVVTVAQISILSELKEAIRAYDDFLVIAQKQFPAASA
eukprot:CAMPEP_0198139906 /NCGR_PEP_ID=MMETSP1443-20131203/3138_1 /TAXON_ID=186043 /ORGANISM="Entomoneis sp., Strain CCMP2396" /LENGTH=280 /DNA_ID=CAMNT_0043802169 /DNA_START=1 /DNA_END=843 /DNA_ORIENTATION=-